MKRIVVGVVSLVAVASATVVALAARSAVKKKQSSGLKEAERRRDAFVNPGTAA